MSGIPAGAGQLLGKRLGKYEILALLALGGTAEIYLARIGGAAGFEKFVVVKCLHDHLADDMEFVKMFLDEARLAAHLDHSNIVQTMELGEHEHRYYMVMEFLAGLSLAMVVRRAGERLPGGRMPVPLSLNIIAQSCAGLHYAHEKAMNGKALNIVHRDISPQNLVVSFEGVVKVVDFGIAKAELRETQTRSGTIKGKFAYMSPEQCVAANVDRRTDIFALGVIAHELLTGKRLFKKPSPYETYQAVIECNVDAPSRINHELDPAVDAIIMKALAKDKENRYQSAEAFGDALLGYLHHRAKSSGPNEVAAFFDHSFAQEIEEHGARMRELIGGRDVGIAGGWSEEDEAEAKRKDRETMDLELGASGAARPSSRALDDVVSGLTGSRRSETNDDGDGGDDDDMPAEKTRIESNPLELLQAALAAAPAKPASPVIPKLTPLAAPTPAQQPTVVAAIPTPPPMMAVQPAPRNTPQPMKVPSIVPPSQVPMTGPLRLPEPPLAGNGAPMRPSGPLPAGKAPNVPSGRFPDSANMATQMAPLPDEDNEETKDAARAFPDSFPDRSAPGDPTVRPGQLQNGGGGAYGVHASGMLAVEPAMQSTQIAPPIDLSKVPRTLSPGASTGLDLAPHPSSPPAHGPLSGMSPIAGPLPQIRPSVPSLANYPVMDARMSAAIASSADVFPSDPVPGGRIARPSPGIPDSGMVVRPPDSGPQAFDPQRAVDLASPVGGAYPEQDWSAVAAMPAKALTTMQLVLLFIGALGAAMVVVIIIAKLAH